VVRLYRLEAEGFILRAAAAATYRVACWARGRACQLCWFCHCQGGQHNVPCCDYNYNADQLKVSILQIDGLKSGSLIFII
jgi:hypothetical protein